MLPSRSPQLTSTVQVAITFENPVVFAGQSLKAVITFKNTDEGPEQQGVNSTSLLAQELDNHGLQSTTTKTRPTRALSTQSNKPLLSRIETGIIEHPVPSLESPSLALTPNDMPALAANVPTVSPSTSTRQESPITPRSEEPIPTELSGWEMPGKRLSSQLANSLRELYQFSTSAPDVNEGAPISPTENVLRNPPLSRQGSHTHNRSRSGTHFQRDATQQGLLMGFAQVQGYFMVDDELIDINEFAHVRNKGVVRGSNGELGYGSSNGNGLLKGLASGLGSFLNIGDNNGDFSDGRNSPDLVGRGVAFGQSSSSLRRPNGIGRGNSLRRSAAQDQHDAIPIFSTPQSLLFVDLKLGPGESKSFSYSLELPKMLPPSCRARSIRIYYNLVVGIQKLDKRGRPQPKTNLVPFRVFPYISKDGQQFVHDLRAPIVLQKDTAKVVQLPDRHMSLDQVSDYVADKLADRKPEKGDDQAFIAYLEDLLSPQHTAVDMAPTPSEVSVRRLSTSQENIKYFTRHQHAAAPNLAIKSRFDIRRSGNRLATVILSKPVYRVGENIVFMVDYTDAVLKTFHITATLETEETISSDLLKQFKNQHQEHLSQKPVIDTSAMTRRVYSQATMSTYSHEKCTFEFTIPATATPQFATSSIALKWMLKIDFITSAAPPQAQPKHTENQDPSHEHYTPQPSTTSDNVRRGSDTLESSSPTSRSVLSDAPSSNPITARSPAHTSLASTQSECLKRSAITVVHLTDQGVIATTKETIPCDTFSCKIPITIVPTNQDISALLEHSVSATRIWRM